MYLTQDIANRIKQTAKENGIQLNEILQKSGLNKNAISEFSKGKQMSVISFAKIADCLDCPIDYLLGRTAAPLNEPEDEHRLIKAYRELTDEGKKAILTTAELYASSKEYQKYTDIPKEA